MYNKIERGEIYRIRIPNATGHEIMKDRPGVIVSCDALNQTSPNVAVVFFSATNKRELPENIAVQSTPLPSVAMCNHLYTVDKERVGRYEGRCTEEEMARIENGIRAALGMGMAADDDVPYGEDAEAEEQVYLDALTASIQRDTYKEFCERLLDRMERMR